MLSWSLYPISLDLKYTWTISRGSVFEKTNYLVSVRENNQTMLGEVAGITQKEINESKIPHEFEQVKSENPQNFEDIFQLNISSPLRFGLESALTHLRCKQKGINIYQFLKTPPPQKIETSYSVPIIKTSEIKNFLDAQNIYRFTSCKVKIDSSSGVDNCLEVAKYYQGPLRIDANESFSNAKDVLNFIAKIKHLEVQLIEQPMPSSMYQEYKLLKSQSPVPIFADESIQEHNIDQQIAEQFHGVNIKLMKAGSYRQALKQIRSAKQLGLMVMSGCMLETSLGISSALAISAEADFYDLDGFLFFKNEPFDLLTETKGLISVR